MSNHTIHCFVQYVHLINLLNQHLMVYLNISVLCVFFQSSFSPKISLALHLDTLLHEHEFGIVVLPYSKE